MDDTCFLTELFFLERVSLQASHLRFPDTVVRHWSLNSFTLSHADTFGSTDPRTFLFFSAGLVCTFLFREILAFSGVLNLAPALAATSKGSEYSSSSLELHAIRDSASPNPKMHRERKNIEIEMYCGPKYNQIVGAWSLTLETPG